MKKVYITPSAEALNFVTETTILAGSFNVDVEDGVNADASESFAGGQSGWSSENWSGGEEE